MVSELKEAQIRDGCMFGASPIDRQRRDTLLALARFRWATAGARAGLIGALARDLALGDDFDPLAADWAAPWAGPRPAILQALDTSPWRHAGDTRERLERLAQQWLDGLCAADGGNTGTDATPPGDWPHTLAVIERVRATLLPALDACGGEKCASCCAGSTAASCRRGRAARRRAAAPDVLPTGRNFYSVDTRAVPTQAAWSLGLKSAQQLIERHLQDHGDYPRAIGLSVWGTATMRTGGDDIAQAFALLGVRPKWAHGSHRATDFEILPIEIFDRPRIDGRCACRASSATRSLNLMHLFDAAVQAVAALDEPEALNPIRARIEREREKWVAQGVAPDEARRRAGWRVFGARPGSYGAGLQDLIDQRRWQTDADLADAYRQWAAMRTHRTARAMRRPTCRRAARDDRCRRAEPAQPRARHPGFERLLPVPGRDDRGRAAPVRAAAEHLPRRPRESGRAEDAHAARGNRARDSLARRQPEMARRREASWRKGAAELAATVDYLYGYDATARVLSDHQYALVADAYLFDDATRAFLERHIRKALHGIANASSKRCSAAQAAAGRLSRADRSGLARERTTPGRGRR